MFWKNTLSSVSAVAPVPGRAGAGESVEELCQGTAQRANRLQHYSGWLKTRGRLRGVLAQTLPILPNIDNSHIQPIHVHTSIRRVTTSIRRGPDRKTAAMVCTSSSPRISGSVPSRSGIYEDSKHADRSGSSTVRKCASQVLRWYRAGGLVPHGGAHPPGS